MKFNIYPQEFPALSRYLLRFADGGRFRTSLSAVQSAARDVGELPASLRGAAFRQIAYAPARETQKYRIFVRKANSHETTRSPTLESPEQRISGA